MNKNKETKTIKIFLKFSFINIKKVFFDFSKYINSVIKYCIKIKNPTILMLIKNAVKKDKIIKFD